MNLSELGIGKDEILDLAATKLADEFGDAREIYERAAKVLRERIEEVVKTRVVFTVEATLFSEMEKIMREKVTPVDIWGEKTGEPTTIRAQLADKALVFWETKVSEDGKPTSYGGSTRAEQVMRKVAQEEFQKALRGSVSEVVVAFKASLKQGMAKSIEDHINHLIPGR
jgi:predicted transcriptional regulator